MITFTTRYVNGHFVVIGPNISLMRFKSRAEAMDWCQTHYHGSPTKEVGADGEDDAASRAEGVSGRAENHTDA
jgi:hypothetical protein